MYLSQNLNHLLKVKGVKNTHFAQVLGVSGTQVGNYLRGSSVPKLESLIEVAKFFDVNLDDLILKDLSKEVGRPFGAEGEDHASADATLDRMNKLLEQRVAQLEEEMKRENPERARELGIE